MSERQPSRIEEARQRALDAKQKLGVAAATAFVAILGLAWASHPGSSFGSSSGAAADQLMSWISLSVREFTPESARSSDQRSRASRS